MTMSDRRPAPLLVCICLLLAAAQVFAFVPQLHACALGVEAAEPHSTSGTATGAPGASTTQALAAPAAWRGPRAAKGGAEDCSACRIANMALVVQEGLPATAALTPAGAAVQTPLQMARSLRLSRACGRAPPHA
jgi:hypothetical protein